MGLFDIFTGSGQARAQKTVRGFQGQNHEINQDTLRAGFANARNEMIQGRDAAIHTLQGSRDAAHSALQRGAEAAETAISQGKNSALDAHGNARQAFAGAGDAYGDLQALSDDLGAGFHAYNDALGLNGQEGHQRARAAFSNSLQNTFEFDQGLEAINRARAARGAGTVSGGNIDRDAQVFGQSLAHSRSGAYLERLLGQADRKLATEGTIAAGRASAQNAIGQSYLSEAGLNERAAQMRAGIATGTASQIAALSGDTGSAVADLQAGVADRLAALAQGQAMGEIGLRQDFENKISHSILAERDARDRASQNLFDTGFRVFTNFVDLYKKRPPTP